MMDTNDQLHLQRTLVRSFARHALAIVATFISGAAGKPRS